MVPSWSAALSSMCGAILMIIRRDWSMRSIEASFLCMGLGALVLTLQSCWPRLGCVNHISHVHHAVHPARVRSVSLVSHLGCMAHLASHGVSGPCEAAGSPRGPLLKSFI